MREGGYLTSPNVRSRFCGLFLRERFRMDQAGCRRLSDQTKGQGQLKAAPLLVPSDNRCKVCFSECIAHSQRGGEVAPCSAAIALLAVRLYYVAQPYDKGVRSALTCVCLRTQSEADVDAGHNLSPRASSRRLYLSSSPGLDKTPPWENSRGFSQPCRPAEQDRVLPLLITRVDYIEGKATVAIFFLPDSSWHLALV